MLLNHSETQIFFQISISTEIKGLVQSMIFKILMLRISRILTCLLRLFLTSSREKLHMNSCKPKIRESSKRLDRLEIRWVDYAGTPVDFQIEIIHSPESSNTLMNLTVLAMIRVVVQLIKHLILNGLVVVMVIVEQ